MNVHEIWTTIVEPSSTPTGFGIGQIDYTDGTRLTVFGDCCENSYGLQRFPNKVYTCKACYATVESPATARGYITEIGLDPSLSIINKWVESWTGLEGVEVDLS